MWCSCAEGNILRSCTFIHSATRSALALTCSGLRLRCDLMSTLLGMRKFSQWYRRGKGHRRSEKTSWLSVFRAGTFICLVHVCTFTYLLPWYMNFDWCCFYYFVRKSLVALLDALCTREWYVSCNCEHLQFSDHKFTYGRRVLQHEYHGDTLQHTANILPHTTTNCSTLQHTAAHCSTHNATDHTA